MRLQLLSDLHLETEAYTPEPAADAELLVLAGDVDSTWAGLERFARWPVPVLFVAGNHEFDRRELRSAWPALRAHCESLGITLLEREQNIRIDKAGRRIRFVATTRWCDFDLFGAAGRERAMRAAGYFMHVMRSSCDGRLFDAAAVRDEALACRAWLQQALAEPGDTDATVVITHYGPSLRSADPRYGGQPGSASFCNADDDLLPFADLWLHGHLHCRHDYTVGHPPGTPRASTRVVSNARGHARKGEAAGHDGLLCIKV
ncbi:metallophosphoesterase [Methylibium sp.]|uniref:metallophosphoesterase n=1 Tax=Methylibium sp. TaxID=2067992 RepID=UPI003D0D3E1B